MSQTPPISLELVEYVERLYPNRCPDLSMSDRQVWFKAGQAEMALKLRQQYTLQTRSLLEVL